MSLLLLPGVLLDRAFETDARVHGASVTWDAATPNALSYERTAGGRGSAAELQVVQRAVEAPSEKGWGSNELLRITTSTGSVLGQGGFEITYAARVQRRWRRAEAATGERVRARAPHYE